MIFALIGIWEDLAACNTLLRGVAVICLQFRAFWKIIIILKTTSFQNIRETKRTIFDKSLIFSFFLQPACPKGRKMPRERERERERGGDGLLCNCRSSSSTSENARCLIRWLKRKVPRQLLLVTCVQTNLIRSPQGPTPLPTRQMKMEGDTSFVSMGEMNLVAF